MPKSEEPEDVDHRENAVVDPGSDEPGSGTSLPLAFTSRVLYMLGDLTGHRFTQWLELVRKRTAQDRSSGFPRPVPLRSGEPHLDLKDSAASEQNTEISLWERLGNATMLDIESSSFSWNKLSSLHHTEHNGSSDQSEDDTGKPLEVTVNSGGVVFFGLFNLGNGEDFKPKEAAAVIKFSSSRMATQSERLGYEFAKCLGVKIPQARVIHSCSPEWIQIKEAAEKARDAAISEGDEVGEMTCSEILEALELSRCLFLMNYVHGSPLLENQSAFESPEAAEKIATALGRILMLDLVIRNEDRLPCRQLGWRGNFANLLLSEGFPSADMDVLEYACETAIEQYKPKFLSTLQRRTSDDCRLETQNKGLYSQEYVNYDLVESPISNGEQAADLKNKGIATSDFNIVAIDSGVPRRPPAGKRANDLSSYPKLVELLLNIFSYSSSLLYEITGGKLGFAEDDKRNDSHSDDMVSIILAFRGGFRDALRNLQRFHIFLLRLDQNLDCLLRSFMSIINRTSCCESDKEDLVPESSMSAGVHCHSLVPPTREHAVIDTATDSNDVDLRRSATRQLSIGPKDISDSTSPNSRENSLGKSSRWSAEPVRCLRLTSKLREFVKNAKVDAELSKELEQWNETLRNDVVKLCQENNFNTGFFEGSDTYSVVDAYELKVRLEHILERISLISDAADTEKPSSVTSNVFIGGALAARSQYTLQHLRITHILCLCSNEIGQSDSQFPDVFEYRNFSISDEEDSNISNIFEEACDFIDDVERQGGKVLVHCFEGRSRSVTLVLAYLMLRKSLTLQKAWNSVKKVHRRAQPNDGFGRVLLELDKKLHGKVSMEWQQRKPSMKVCPFCGKNAGLSSGSLKLHLQKSHKKISSGSVDSAMALEIEKALATLKISRGGSITANDVPSMSD